MAEENVKASPEGWRAWPLWLRVLLVVIALLLLIGGGAFLLSLPAPSRTIEIVGQPQIDYIAFVIPYTSRQQLLVPQNNTMGQAERICVGIDAIALGTLPEGTDQVTQAQQAVRLFANDQPFSSDQLSFAYDPTVTAITDSAGQIIRETSGTVSICMRTAALSSGDYIGTLVITSTDGQERTYDWAFTIRE
ncbi:MAG: hypothetical protein HXY40_15795 [Chloroflexi bacterium]|nr:hypothetical protein [Chloroflexota bacterium]